MVSYRERSLLFASLCSAESPHPVPGSPGSVYCLCKSAFSRCHIVGIITLGGLSRQFLSLSNVHVSFLLVFSGLDSSCLLMLNNIPLSERLYCFFFLKKTTSNLLCMNPLLCLVVLLSLQPGGLLNTDWPVPPSGVLDSVGLGWELRFCISKDFLGLLLLAGTLGASVLWAVYVQGHRSMHVPASVHTCTRVHIFVCMDARTCVSACMCTCTSECLCVLFPCPGGLLTVATLPESALGRYGTGAQLREHGPLPPREGLGGCCLCSQVPPSSRAGSAFVFSPRAG